MKFKCKSTGLVYEFEFEVDILSMQKHPDYEPVVETKEAPKPTPTSKKAAKNEINISGDSANSGN